MQAKIILDNTVFDFKSVVSNINSFIKVPNKAGTHLYKFIDFGVVLVDWDTISTEEQESISLWLIDSPCPVFTCPGQWRMPQLLRALGAFNSATAASKNGWDKNIESGLTFHQIRINNIKGILTTFRVVNQSKE